MDIDKMKQIAAGTLSVPYEPKSKSNDWAGIYVFGDDKPFILSEHIHAIHSFFVFSKYDYPLYFFINQYRTEGIKDLIGKYNNNIKFIPIPPLLTSFEYNYFMINKAWYLLPEHQYCVTMQFDGWILKSGFEKAFEDGDYDMAGASWKEPIKIKESVFNFPATRMCNGGFSFRRPFKMLDVLYQIDQEGGQTNVVKGLLIDGKERHSGPYVCEDIFFNYFGQGLGILNVPTVEDANKFSLEPIPFKTYRDKERCSYGFHRCDE